MLKDYQKEKMTYQAETEYWGFQSTNQRWLPWRKNCECLILFLLHEDICKNYSFFEADASFTTGRDIACEGWKTRQGRKNDMLPSVNTCKGEHINLTYSSNKILETLRIWE